MYHQLQRLTSGWDSRTVWYARCSALGISSARDEWRTLLQNLVLLLAAIFMLFVIVASFPDSPLFGFVGAAILGGACLWWIQRKCKHDFDGCNCRRCGSDSPEKHDWSEGCVCRRCGELSPPEGVGHVYQGCLCSLCGLPHHKWTIEEETCSSCGGQGGWTETRWGMTDWVNCTICDGAGGRTLSKKCSQCGVESIDAAPPSDRVPYQEIADVLEQGSTEYLRTVLKGKDNDCVLYVIANILIQRKAGLPFWARRKIRGLQEIV